jgi:hypothetical protein
MPPILAPRGLLGTFWIDWWESKENELGANLIDHLRTHVLAWMLCSRTIT